MLCNQQDLIRVGLPTFEECRAVYRNLVFDSQRVTRAVREPQVKKKICKPNPKSTRKAFLTNSAGNSQNRFHLGQNAWISNCERYSQ